MTNSTIQRVGLFDSGVGGLTVLSAMHQRYPGLDYIYYGDNANAPYGDKHPHMLEQCHSQVIDHLLEHRLDALVFACNTSTSLFFESTKAKVQLPCFEPITAAAKYAVKSSVSGRIGVVATTHTCQHHLYKNALESESNDVQVVEFPAPALVPIIETGELHNALHRETLEAPVKALQQQHVDTLIYGCTHYPFLESIWSAVAPEITFIDPAKALADSLILETSTKKGSITLLSSGPLEPLEMAFERIFKRVYAA